MSHGWSRASWIRRAVLLAAVFVVCGALGAGGAVAGTNRVLIVKETVVPNIPNGTGNTISLEEKAANDAGLTATVVGAAAFLAMRAADFDGYDAIILGDHQCAISAQLAAHWNGPITNADWAAGTTGNVILVGSDPVATYQQTSNGQSIAITESAVRFAAAGTGRGLYASLSCYWQNETGTVTLPLPAALGTFRIDGSRPGGAACPSQVGTVVLQKPAFTATFTDDALASPGRCTAREFFVEYPASYDVIATSAGRPFVVARDSAAKPPDEDGDGVPDSSDLCPGTPSSTSVDGSGCSDAQVDSDGDGFCDVGAPSDGPSHCVGVDNCPTVANRDQADSDFDGIGDACDARFGSTRGHVEGEGKVAGISFAFNAEGGNKPQGEVTISTRPGFRGRVTGVAIKDNVANIVGTSSNGTPFLIHVVDNGRSNDTISIKAGTLSIGGTLTSGKIKIELGDG